MSHSLVTAGNTREPIDRVRDWGNIFTGNTGFAIARALAALGPVDLLTSNPAHLEQAGAFGITAAGFRTHADLNDLLNRTVPNGGYDAVFMTAAVSDYTPLGTYAVVDRRPLPDGTEAWVVRDAQAAKVKSDHPAVAVLGGRTEKLVDRFRRDWGYGNLLVKFKLEVGIPADRLLAIAQASRRASGADYLVANTLAMTGGADAGAYLVSEHATEWVPRGGLAERCATLVRGLSASSAAARPS